MKKRIGLFSCINAVLLVVLFAASPPAPAHSEEDVYIEGEQSHFKLEKGKRYHGKWTREKPPAERPTRAAQPRIKKQMAPEPPPAEPPPAEPPPAEPEPVMEKGPAAEPEKPEPEKMQQEEPPQAEASAYEKLQKTMQAVESGSSTGDASSQTSSRGGPAAGMEISDQPGVLSCKYMGIVTIMVGIDKDEEKEVLRLIFTNKTNKEIQGIWGGFDIKDSSGSRIYATGITDTMNKLKPGGTSKFDLFSFSPKIDEKVVKALSGESGSVTLEFGVNSVEHSDGTKVDF